MRINRDLIKTAIEFIGKIGDKQKRVIEKNLFIKRVSEKLGIAQELLKKEINEKDTQLRPNGAIEKQTVDPHIDPVEIHLIRLLLEYPQKTAYVESEKVLDFFLHPELKNLGGKIVEAYKLLGYIDINVILSADEDKPLREKIYKLMMEAPPDR